MNDSTLHLHRIDPQPSSAVRDACAGLDMAAEVAQAAQEGPSKAILRRLGFEHLGAVEHPDDGPVWKWRER